MGAVPPGWKVHRLRPKVLLVTNLAPPYRLPVWEALGAEVDLTVAILEPNLHSNDENPVERSLDWHVEADRASGYRLVSLPTRQVSRGEDGYYLLRRGAAEVRGRYDLVILGGWESPAYWQLRHAARRAHVAVLGFYESNLASSRFSAGPITWLRRRFMRSLDGFIVPGASAEESVREKGVTRVWRGFNAVDVARFASAARSAEPGDGTRFLFVGKLIDRKNVAAVLRALSQLDQGELGIAGSGAETGALRELARQLGIADRVTWHDYVPYEDLPALMTRYDTLVLASHVEVWGLVVNEALASGMQVVVSRNCGVAASVADMPGVFLCDTDAWSVAAAMRSSMDRWAGRIQNPPILDHTPEAFAQLHAQAVRETLAS